MKLSRIAQLGAVAAVAALTLTACAANEGGTTAPSETASAGPALSGSLTGQAKLWDVHLESRPPAEVHRALSQLPAFQRAQSGTGLVPTAAEPAPVPARLRPGAYKPER